MLGALLLSILLAACSSTEIPEETIPTGESREAIEMRTGSPVAVEMSLEEALATAEQELAAQDEDEGLQPQFTTTTGILMSHIRDTSLRIGVDYEDPGRFTNTQKNKFKEHIRNAIRAWLNPLRSMYGGGLITNSILIYDVTNSSNSVDLTVRFPDENGRASYNAGAKEIVMHANRNDSYMRYLHEFGHAFGLGDAYIEGIWTCQAGQYTQSVMCDDNAVVDLTADDLRGIKYNYCRTFSNCNSNDYLDMYGGNGGSLATSECSSDKIVGGIRVRSGSKIDALEIRCRTFPYGTYTAGSPTVKFGGSGGSYNYHYCGYGEYVHGVKLRTGGLVDSFQFYCTNGDISNWSGGWSPQYGGNSGSIRYYFCPPEYPAMKGLRGKGGSLVDKIGLTCSTKDGEYSINL